MKPDLRPGRVIYFYKGEMGTNIYDPYIISMRWRWRDVTPSSRARVRRLMAVMDHSPGERRWQYMPFYFYEDGE